MKSTVNKTEKSRTYPYLGILKNHDQIVLFIGPSKGVIFHSNSKSNDNPVNKIGYFTNTLLGESFDVFDGTVELSN